MDLIEKSPPPAVVPDRLQVVKAYHQRTKHRFEAYAAGPSTLDWDAQPAAFRHYAGAVVTPLPLVAGLAEGSALRVALNRPFAEIGTGTAQAATLESLGALLNLALGITAWKTMGPDRWAVRANPSSGNLHPIEAYVLVAGFEGLADGVYHYDPLDHVLSLRAALAGDKAPAPALAIGLSSVMWREAWKYGERAFRYCQLDCGHAMGALRYAAGALGWGMQLLALPQQALGHLLGLDRSEDFPGRATTEREEAEVLLAVHFPASAGLDLGAWTQALAGAVWQGKASTIDRHPMFRWPVVDAVAQASRRAPAADAAPLVPATSGRAAGSGSQRPLAQVVLGRRSAQRFDVQHVMPREMLLELVEALSAPDGLPWDLLGRPARIALLVIVHRVDGLAPGAYLLPRSDAMAGELRTLLPERLTMNPVEGIPGLRFLAGVDPQPLKRTARSLHCHQDIASSSCLALGMLARFDVELDADPAAYRDLLREAGLIGQALYLLAEARGLRGTGIGCYFDDPVHDFVGLPDRSYQSLYHFTLGLPLDDARIETGSPYPHRTSRTFP